MLLPPARTVSYRPAGRQMLNSFNRLPLHLHPHLQAVSSVRNMRFANTNLLKNATRNDSTVHSLKLPYYTSLHIYYVEDVSNKSRYITTSYQCDEPLLSQLNVGVISDRHEPKLHSPDNFNAVTNKTFPNYTIKQTVSHFLRSFSSITDSNTHTDRHGDKLPSMCFGGTHNDSG